MFRVSKVPPRKWKHLFLTVLREKVSMKVKTRDCR